MPTSSFSPKLLSSKFKPCTVRRNWSGCSRNRSGRNSNSKKLREPQLGCSVCLQDFREVVFFGSIQNRSVCGVDIYIYIYTRPFKTTRKGTFLKKRYLSGSRTNNSCTGPRILVWVLRAAFLALDGPTDDLDDFGGWSGVWGKTVECFGFKVNCISQNYSLFQ